MGQELLSAICDQFSPYQFYGGEVLFSNGEPADAWLFLGLGQLEVEEVIL